MTDARCIVGPSAAAIGWIPFFRSIRNVPAESYTQHELAQSFRFLFRSGNRPRPPASFVDDAEFLEFLDGMNLRAALAAWDVKLYCKEGRPEAIVCRHEEWVGYTPFVLGRTTHYSMDDASERYAFENICAIIVW